MLKVYWKGLKSILFLNFKLNSGYSIESLKRGLTEDGVLVLFVGTDCISFFSDCFWGDCGMHFLPGANHKVIHIVCDAVTVSFLVYFKCNIWQHCAYMSSFK